MKVAVVIPVGPGRTENLAAVMGCLRAQKRPPDMVVIVFDGDEALPQPGYVIDGGNFRTLLHMADKFEPSKGMEQPRNIGTRLAFEQRSDLTHVAFLDSDVVIEPGWLETLERGFEAAPEDRILVAPYDWLPRYLRPSVTSAPSTWQAVRAIRNDPRWEMFNAHGPGHVFRGDLSAGLACFSGNLVWPIGEFMRVGGFWSEIHHGRCEDGELGLRAVAMGVPISLVAGARGYHLHHAVNTQLAMARNSRDVPMLNDRHPWVEGAAVFMVDRDGKAFDVLCGKCQQSIPTIQWWAHAPRCGVSTALPVP